jgi:uncharacterized protein (TIGR03067 family)
MNASLLVALALAVGAPATKDPPKKEAPSVVGEWAGEKAVQGGQERPVPPGGVSITFTADGKFLVREGKREKPEEGTYKVDTKANPAQIDIMPPEDKAERGNVRGIFKIEGDTLTLCFAGSKDDGERPTKFESPEGSRTMVMTLKRVKKD